MSHVPTFLAVYETFTSHSHRNCTFCLKFRSSLWPRTGGVRVASDMSHDSLMEGYHLAQTACSYTPGKYENLNSHPTPIGTVHLAV